MRMVQIVLLATIITVASSVNVVAVSVFDTGKTLLELCRGNGWKDGYCTGYVSAIADAMSFDSLSGWRSCQPNEVTVGQVSDIVKTWLESHPQDRHYAASSLTAQALAEAFPCRE